MALLQCGDFFSKHPHMKVVEANDTAESAQELRDKKLISYAAIASPLAAKTFGLEILEQGIESNKQNYTRFLIICRAEDYVAAANANKAALRFETPHVPGSLVRILEIFHQHAINMTKVQSVVIPGRPYEYSFHVDLEWQDRDAYETALVAVKEAALGLIDFGVFPRGQKSLPPVSVGKGG